MGTQPNVSSRCWESSIPNTALCLLLVRGGRVPISELWSPHAIGYCSVGCWVKMFVHIPILATRGQTSWGRAFIKPTTQVHCSQTNYTLRRTLPSLPLRASWGEKFRADHRCFCVTLAISAAFISQSWYFVRGASATVGWEKLGDGGGVHILVATWIITQRRDLTAWPGGDEMIFVVILFTRPPKPEACWSDRS